MNEEIKNANNETSSENQTNDGEKKNQEISKTEQVLKPEDIKPNIPVMSTNEMMEAIKNYINLKFDSLKPSPQTPSHGTTKVEEKDTTKW